MPCQHSAFRFPCRSERSAYMKKKILAVVAITCLAVVSFAAQSKTYRDGQGRLVGRSRTDSSGRVTFRDSMGASRGSASTHGNHTTYRDSMGRIEATSRTDASGCTTFRDSSGRLLGTARTDSSGRVIYRDSMGRIQGTATTDPSGKVTYRDGQGRLKGTKR